MWPTNKEPGLKGMSNPELTKYFASFTNLQLAGHLDVMHHFSDNVKNIVAAEAAKRLRAITNK